jgi:NDP-sugar pyrophosphorylase family protein
VRALVLAAGYGDRLRPLTDRIPKPMIEIGGKPILQHNLELLGRAGVREVAVNVHYRPDSIRTYFGDGFALGAALTYFYEPELLGTAGAIRNAAEFLRGDDFLVVYGDNLSTIDLRALIARHREREAEMTLALYHRDDPGQSGIVGLDESDRITRFLEKPSPEDIFSHWVNAGYLVAKPSLLDAIPHRTPCDLGRDLFALLLQRGAKLAGYRMTEELWWIDTLEDYERTKTAFEGAQRA